MVRFKFKQLVQHYGFPIQKIHNETGISRNTLTELYHNRVKRIDTVTLDRLLIFFNKYFSCTISDILEFINEEEN